MTKVMEKWNKMPLAVKVSVAYAVCSILQKCISFVTLPLFTRLLTTEQFGQVTIYGSWMGILSIILTLNLAYGSFSTAMVKFENDREGYIASIEGIFITLTIVFFIIYVPFRATWNKILELPTYIVCVMVAEIIASNAILLWSGKKRFEFKYKSVVAITLIMSIVSPFIQYLLVITNTEKGYARIIGAASVTICIGGAFFITNAIKGKRVYNSKYWKYACSFNIPLLAYYLSQIVFNQSDRIMISHMVGTDKSAIYGVAYTLATVLIFVLNAINNSYVPWYYGKIKEGKMRDNQTVSLAIALLMAILLLGVIWFAPEIIRIMAGEKYEGAIYVVPPVAASILLLFYTQIFANVEFFYEEKHKLVWASIGAAVINLVLNWVFIPRFGFVAAAYTTLVSYIVFTISNFFAMRRTLAARNIEENGFNYKGMIALFIGFIVISYIGMLLYEFPIPRILISVIVLGIIFIKREMMFTLYREIKK